MLFEPYVRFHTFRFSSGNWVAAYLGIAVHPAYDMFSWYKYLSVILVFSHHSVYGVGISSDFLIIAYFKQVCFMNKFRLKCMLKILTRVLVLEILMANIIFDIRT